MANFATVVATVRLPDTDGPGDPYVTLTDVVSRTLQDRGYALVGCNWTPDGDTIVDQMEFDHDEDEHDVLDLNPRAHLSPRELRS